MTDQTNSKETGETPGLDSLVEDLFGLNLRGLNTIVQLLISPKKVFTSARVSDWRRQYTPTLRLTFSIITVFMLLSFFWAAEESMMYQALLAQFEAAAAAADNPPSPEALRETLDRVFAAYAFLYPFIYMLLHGLVASLIFFWGRGTGWVTRVRLYFALLAVGMSVSLASMLITPFLDADMLGWFTVIGMSIGLFAYWITYVRGMSGTHGRLGVFVRATFIALIITFVDLLIGGVSGYSAGFWVSRFGA